jgi:CHASE3 domain sensor protein
MMAKSLLNRKAQIAFGSAIVILLAMGAFSYHSMVESSESNHWAQHTDEVLASLQQLLIATTKVESSGRGFALSGQ